ncbi:MAG: MinD/ParA family protein [Peptococcaceae bacterium]|nr:MinD/ParA family protein [Peptococcaceae bacterium]
MDIRLYPNQNVVFSTDAELYRDIYKTHIVNVHKDRLELALTLHKGYLLMLPVGTSVQWMEPASAKGMYSEVIDRQVTRQVWCTNLPTLRDQNPRKKTRVIAIGSGKGGVGKTTLAINLAVSLQKMGHKVVVMDADIGMANIEVLLNMKCRYNLTHVLKGDCQIPDILAEGPLGIKVIPGSSGIVAFTNLSPLQFNRILSGFIQLERVCDYLIVDTGAGISELVLKFLEAADDIILVTTPEPHAMLDTFAITKVLYSRNKMISPKLVFNMCESEQEAKKSTEKFIYAVSEFLLKRPEYLGWIFDDKRVSKSLKSREIASALYPDIEFSQQIESIARSLLGKESVFEQQGGIVSFFNKLKRNLG